MSEPRERTYLGLDFSTQQLKAAVLDDDLNVLHETCVQYDNDLPEFRTYGGALHPKDEPGSAAAPTLMWVKALDMILDRLRVCGVDFGRVAGVSGCAQQHGTVYWARGARRALNRLDPDRFLHEQLVAAFSVSPAPIWMDSSTGAECRRLEEVAGGAKVRTRAARPEASLPRVTFFQRLAEITGSRATERFAGPQIAKLARRRPEAYENTERISLVSSFAASLFLGDYAPIDWADGSGMNLLDIRAKDWRDELLEACAPGLRERLGQPVSSSTDLGPLSGYFVERFGFREGCRVVAFTGDNPCSLAGLRLKEGELACSLGTSDALFLYLSHPRTSTDGSVFCNPVRDDAYMALIWYGWVALALAPQLHGRSALCRRISFKNGSLTRERVRDAAAGSDWRLFDELLDNTPRGNFGNLGLYYDAPEILPRGLDGDHRFNRAGDRVARYSSVEVEVRALVEGQFVARRAHAEDFGFVVGPGCRIVATGGASGNRAMLQEAANSAVLGAAYRAKHALLEDGRSFEELLSCLPEPTLVCQPYPDAESIYKPMLQRYRRIVEQLTSGQRSD
ncbi:xylulose kinase isoform X7 [Phymastichus coffea]|uniref:xylulose kinase isoform X7 n=1 Tax=Phymastichus coffea TaxID=108790 RepID=UPI00273C1F59|nr:xylulose kinase isoform X7 [Phymastichus coffea]